MIKMTNKKGSLYTQIFIVILIIVCISLIYLWELTNSNKMKAFVEDEFLIKKATEYCDSIEKSFYKLNAYSYNEDIKSFFETDFWLILII